MEKAKAATLQFAPARGEGIIPNPKKKLLDQVREVIRLKHYSIRTEQTYVDWIKRFIFFHGKRHPREMGASEIEAFLTHLAVNRDVAASTQNQALNALVFLYREGKGSVLENGYKLCVFSASKPGARADSGAHQGGRILV